MNATRKFQVLPSILTADFGDLTDVVRRLDAAGADALHLDVMDGRFVPNLTFGPVVVEAIRKATSLPLDVHLMIESPESLVGEFARAGADWISVHAEACVHLHRVVQVIRAQRGLKKRRLRAGVALNPATPLAAVEGVLGDIDFVLCMTVNPGFGGQSFIADVIPKVRHLRALAERRGLHDLDIEVDGGINESTLPVARDAGASLFVAGSAVVGSRDWKQTIARLKAVCVE